MRTSDVKKISDVEINFSLNIPRFIASPKSVPVAKKVIEKYGARDSVPPSVMKEIIERAILAIRNGELVSKRDLEKIAGACLSPDQNLDKKSVSLIFKALQKQGTRKAFSNLFASYVNYFDSDNKNCLEAAKILERNKGRLLKRWSKRLEKIDFLDSKNIEKKIANELLSKGSDAFNDIGLGGKFSSSWLVRNSLVNLADMIKGEVRKGDTAVIDFFIKIICEDDKITDNAGIAAMVGLLSPFFEDNPPAERKNRLQLIFTNSFLDPRIKNAEEWPEIIDKFGGGPFRKKCISLFKKWLIFDTIDLFLKVIAKHAPDEQFEPRRNLWKSYFDQECIIDAHIILGKDAAKTAGSLKGEDQSAIGLRFGEFSSGAGADQSVLLMRIENLIVAEWSHNGKFRAWHDDASYKPELHKEGGYYDASELRKDSNEILQVNGDYGDGIVHLGDWVGRVERYINEETGIRLSRRVR